MSLQARKELLFRMRGRYREADRKQKTEILEGFIAATGYNRKYAANVLRSLAKDPLGSPGCRRTLKYDEPVRLALTSVWNAANQICSKRLKPFLPEFVATLERFGHLKLEPIVRQKLLSLSPATMDRLLKPERSKHGRGISTTKPSNLLKQRIKIRTYAEWDDADPGFFEADLVAHCGDRAEGPFLNSLVLTDIATGWTEFMPILRKSDSDVIAGLDTIRTVLPVPILGLDTDNGCEFINYELLGYCEREKITFTRARAYKKNDQAHIEQKNGSVIRRIVGYDRFEGTDSMIRLISLYRVLRLYINFFQPSVKLIKKTRTGSRTSKQYDEARTPYQRMLDSSRVTANQKTKLRELYQSLDPVDLFQQIGQLQSELWQVAVHDENSRGMLTHAAAAAPVKNTCVTPAADSSLTTLPSLKPMRKHKRPYKVRALHTWRTRKDPLAGTYEYAKLLFSLEPEITSPELLSRLKEKYPEQITGKEIKTVQRRLSQWRKDSLSLQILTYHSDTKYDDLPLTGSLQKLTEMALNL